VPLIRRGKLNSATQATDAALGDLFRLANPIDLVRPPTPATNNFGLLQSTGTQKALFRLPSFQTGLDQLRRSARFRRRLSHRQLRRYLPQCPRRPPLNLGAFKTRILSEGYKLLDQADPDKVFEQLLPPDRSISSMSSSRSTSVRQER
jgi:hypothetical protein